jgi:type VI secretion system protein ImpK
MNQDLAAAPAARAVGVASSPRHENLALIYQEILTAITRLRTSQQAVADVGAFRNSMKAALDAAEAEATRKGYTAEDARAASFAVVSLLDESIMNASAPHFDDWAGQSMLGELFGKRTSEDIFFQCIDRLLAEGNSLQEADVLEVFGLCLLLGYQGSYRTSGPEGVNSIVTSILNKVQSIRGSRPTAPDWLPQPDAVLHPPHDPWVRALAFGTLGALFLAVAFFLGFKVALLSGASGLHSIAPLAPH